MKLVATSNEDLLTGIRGLARDRGAVFWLGIALILGLCLQVFNLLIPSVSYDTSCFIYAAQQLLAGKIPYKDFFIYHPLGGYCMYAGVFFVAGESLSAVRIFSTLYISLTVIAVYYLAKLLYGERAAIVSVFAFVLLNNRPLLQCGADNLRVFMVLPMVMGLYFCLRLEKEVKAPPLVLAGALLGIAFLFHQAVVYNLMAVMAYFTLAYLLGKERELNTLLKKSLLIISGFCLPLLVFSLYVAYYDAFWQMIYCVFTVYKSGSGEGWTASSPKNFLWFFGLLFIEGSVLYLIGMYGLLRVLKERDYRSLFLLTQVLFTLVSISTTGRFFPHYFVQLMPFLAVLCGKGLPALIDNYTPLTPSRRPLVMATLLICSFTSLGIDVYYLQRNQYRYSMYDEIVPYIKSNTRPEDYIYVAGEDRGLYLYTGRQASFFGELPFSDFPEEVVKVRSINNPPRLVITSTVDHKEYPKRMEEFSKAFLQKNGYTLVKKIPFKKRGEVEYFYLYAPSKR